MTVATVRAAEAETPDEVRVAAMLRPGDATTAPPTATPAVATSAPRIIARRLGPELPERDESAISQLWRTFKIGIKATRPHARRIPQPDPREAMGINPTIGTGRRAATRPKTA